MKTHKKNFFMSLTALVLAFLIAGSVNAAAYCKVGTKTYNPGTYTFSNGKWICQTDGEWKKVQTQSYKCRVGTTSYNPGTHGFASGVWICQTNGKWTKAQNQPSTWKCYGTYTCYKKNGKTYATKGGTTWYYSNGKWYKDTKLTTQSTSESTTWERSTPLDMDEITDITETDGGTNAYTMGYIMIKGKEEGTQKSSGFGRDYCDATGRYVYETTFKRLNAYYRAGRTATYDAIYEVKKITCRSTERCVDGECRSL